MDSKSSILAFLQQHRGAQQAVTAEEIARQLFGDGRKARQVRALISELIVEDGHGEIVANPGGESFSDAPRGYFIAQDWQEMETYRMQLLSRLEEMHKR